MTRHLGRTNRIALGLIGAALLAGGLLAVLHGAGVFSSAAPDTALLVPYERHYAAASLWLWPLVGLVAALVAVAAVAWALAQLRPDGVRALSLEADRRQGATRLSAPAVTHALETEIESYEGVQRARAHLVHSARYPRLALRVRLAPGADLPRVRARVERQAMDHLREVLDQEQLPARISFHAAGRRDRRRVDHRLR
ncbi:hypothetical protein [Peterkaempfera griseoplana]|uniref:hypothetical protein n=1 Tax=Peterkaempfera griseoplana TaxID=66896 RepID=UPI0006E1A60D|nr:hypothetical protein [Peterkaempfera griseoplana]